MKYPVLIRKEATTSNFSLSVIDLPGCNVESHSIDSGLDSLQKVIDNHLTILAEYGETIPHGRSIDDHMKKHESSIWAIIDIDIVPYLGKSQKINVTLPELLIKQIDDRVSKCSEHKTRSGFIATVCLKELSKG